MVLVLKRKMNERLFLVNRETREEIVIQVVLTGHASCRLGIEADDAWLIAREEVFDPKAPILKKGEKK